MDRYFLWKHYLKISHVTMGTLKPSCSCWFFHHNATLPSHWNTTKRAFLLLEYSLCPKQLFPLTNQTLALSPLVPPMTYGGLTFFSARRRPIVLWFMFCPVTCCDTFASSSNQDGAVVCFLSLRTSVIRRKDSSIRLSTGRDSP